MTKLDKPTGDFSDFVTIIQTLRGPNGCPWDKQQTHSTLTRYAIEEVYELCEAIENHDDQALRDELGDLLLQVVLHAVIAEQRGAFTIGDVVRAIAEKMWRRHPHVFGDGKAHTASEVSANWQKIKAQEKSNNAKGSENYPFQLPKELPALLYSHKIGEKSRQVKFDWKHVKDVLAKVEEEWAETKAAIANESPQRQQAEIGDLLFSVAQLARHLGFDAEQSLRQTNQRFEKRYQSMMSLAKQQGQDFTQLTEPELEELWQKAKALERAK